jgi:hypothetical protein
MSEEFGQTTVSNSGDATGFCLKLLAEPLELSWRHCGLTSEFFGDYFGRSCASGADPDEARQSISYMINEILENAVKFRHGGDIEIRGSLENDTFEIRVTNLVDTWTASRFQDLLTEILRREPGELLLERMEKNALDPDAPGSGLGLLTLMSDYGARMGWSFETGRASEGIELTTYASLRLS